MSVQRLIDANALPTTEVLTIRRSYRDARKTAREYKTVVTAELVGVAGDELTDIPAPDTLMDVMDEAVMWCD